MTVVLSIVSENVTEMDVEAEVMLSESDGEVEVTVGVVVSISKKLRLSVTAAFPAGSVTVNLQSE